MLINLTGLARSLAIGLIFGLLVVLLEGAFSASLAFAGHDLRRVLLVSVGGILAGLVAARTGQSRPVMRA